MKTIKFIYFLQFKKRLRAFEQSWCDNKTKAIHWIKELGFYSDLLLNNIICRTLLKKKNLKMNTPVYLLLLDTQIILTILCCFWRYTTPKDRISNRKKNFFLIFKNNEWKKMTCNLSICFRSFEIYFSTILAWWI